MSEKSKVFMIMPFDVEFNDLYMHIKNIIEGDYFEVFRADDLLNQHSILKDIVVSINESDLIIADLTGLNPNVFYELGLAHAFRKNVILLTQDISELPFDLRSYRVIQYSTSFTKIKELEKSIEKIMSDFRSGTLLFGSPVTDWVPIQNNEEGIMGRNQIPKIHDHIIVKDDVPDKNREHDEKGFLDFLADIDDSMIELHTLINDFSEQTVEMSSAVNRNAEDIRSAWNNPSAGTASFVRKIARNAAQIMNDYGVFVSNQNKRYEEYWNLFEESATGLVSSRMIDESNPQEFISFINTMIELKNSMFSAKDGIISMAEGASNLKGAESSMNRAVVIIEREIKIFAGLIDKSVATLDRIISVGEERLSKMKG